MHRIKYSCGTQAPGIRSPGIQLFTIVPKMLAVQIILAIEIKLVGVHAGYGNRLLTVLPDLPNILQVCVIKVALAVYDDAYTWVCSGPAKKE